MAIATLVHAIGEALRDGEGDVIELGPGSGWFLETMLAEFPRARIHALDMAPTFINAARRLDGGHVDVVRGDMEALPFRDAAFDVVTTNWTLYFMRDLEAALVGFRRCLKPGGRLVAATVAPDHMQEFDALAADCVRAVTGREPEADAAAAFNTETGMALIRRAFDRVELREWRGELALPDVESALALLPNWGPQDLSADERLRLAVEFGERVAAIVQREGAWRISRHDGAFVAIT